MAESLPHVTVLLSTYNGARFLTEQVESIMSQQGVSVRLMVRDDGSSDGTTKLLRDYAKRSNIDVVYGENVGWKESFTSLMHSATIRNGEYYAFADQDDVWHPDKMVAAIEQIRTFETPAVYHSNVTIVDGQMNAIGNRFEETFRPNSHFPQSFFDGWGVGATMVFNAEMLELVHRYRPNQATNHDALVMALGNMLGDVVYDPSSHISYRRHAGTATGFGVDAKYKSPSLWARFKRYRKGPKHQFSIRAQELLKGYRPLLRDEYLSVLEPVANYSSSFKIKMGLLLNPRIKASGSRKTLQIKYRILMNTL